MNRFTLTRKSYTPADYIEVQRMDEAGAVAYTSADGKVVMGFSGKRQKPDFHIRFRDTERAESYIEDWMTKLQLSIQKKIARREERKAAPNPLKLGDILRSSWGYEQTNIEYYEVTALVGKHSVEIREVARKSEECDGYMQGQCVPAPGHYIGEAMRKRVDESGYVKITSFAWAKKVEEKIIAGVRVFTPDRWTAYA